MDNLVAIIVAIISTGVLNTIVAALINIKTRKIEQDNGVRKAARLLMKTELRNLCVKYIEQGWIYEDELEDIIDMHKVYHDDLNGNGFLNELMSRVKNLDIK